MKVFIANDYKGQESVITGFAEHLRGIREALGRLGVLADRPEDADVALFVGPADFFRPTPGLPNVIFTATESDRFPRDQITEDFLKADLVLCPCEHNRVVFQKIHPNVAVVPLGVDPAAYPFYQRSEPAKNEPFRFLFCGNLHWLKGGPKLIEAFQRWGASGSMPRNCELYVKTNNASKRGGRDFRGLSHMTLQGGEFKHSDTPGLPGITINNLYVETEELRRIYRDAHCFVAPAYGEGWGLCVTEAMSTGLPSIVTGWSAMLDYSDDSTAYLLKPGDWTLKPIPWNPGAGMGAHVKIDRLIHLMRSVYSNYGKALERGQKASEKMHQSYTWDQAGEKLLTILQRYCGVPDFGQRVPRATALVH